MNIQPIKLSSSKLDKKCFISLKTNTKLDSFISNTGGFLPATKIMVTGDPGVGKTTLLLYIQSMLSKHKSLFVSAEMGKVGMSKYGKKFPQFNELDMIFAEDYVDNLLYTFEEVLKNTYHVVMIDSWFALVKLIQITTQKTFSEVENQILEICNRHCQLNNTTFIIIQQVNKAGGFVGKNTLKHLVDSALHIKFDVNKNRYLEFSKNRDGDINEKLYFNVEKNNPQINFTTVSPAIRITFAMQQKAIRIVKKQKVANHFTLADELGIDLDSAYKLAKELKVYESND